ncbi:MAG: SH3 domain-containing protein [Bacteroidetes bacterium]|nr:MAG: SH3 domain-containing protein [Bacteroidota bacterium]
MHIRSLMMVFRTFLLLWVLLSAHGLYAQALLPAPGTWYVTAPSGINLRKSPGATGEKLVSIPYGQQVEVLKTDQLEPDQIETWIEGYWVKVKYQSSVGYVFSAYLCKIPAPQVSISADYCQEESILMGFSYLLHDYAEKHLKPLGASRILYSNGVTELGYAETSRQSYSMDVELVHEQQYESASSTLRFTGDVYQAYSFLEALVRNCPGMKSKIQNPDIQRDSNSFIFYLQDPESQGFYFRISQIDGATVQIRMQSGA